MPRRRLLTWVKEQVTGAEVFHQQVGAELDALQVAVAAAEVEGEDGAEVKHQAGPARVGRGGSGEPCGGEQHVANRKRGNDATARGPWRAGDTRLTWFGKKYLPGLALSAPRWETGQRTSDVLLWCSGGEGWRSPAASAGSGGPGNGDGPGGDLELQPPSC